MSGPVLLFDPTAEGARLAARLRAEGFTVVGVGAAELELLEGGVLLLAAEVPEAAPLLRHRAEHFPACPSLLLGRPGFETHVEHLARPVPFDGLVAAVRRLLGLGPPLREVTMELETGAVARESSRIIARDSGPPSFGGEPAPVDSGRPEPEVPAEDRAQLAPWLIEMLHEADRRVFPDRPALTLHFPAGREGPEELVPDSLLEEPSPQGPPGIDDPLDAFTYVGAVSGDGPSLLPPPPDSQEGDAAAAVPRVTTGGGVPTASSPVEGGGASSERSVDLAERPTGAARPWPKDDPVLGRPGADGTRRGQLGPGGALRLLFRVAALGVSGHLQLRGSGREVELHLRAGSLLSVRTRRGPVYALQLLEGGPLDDALTPEQASARLERQRELGRVSAFGVARALRRGQERALDALLAEEGTTFLARPEEGRAEAGRPLAPWVLASARRVFSAEALEATVGGQGIAARAGARARLEALGVEPELVTLLDAHDGEPTSALFAAAPDVPGLAGLLYGLLAADVLHTVPAPPALAPAIPEPALHRIVAAAARAREGTYFDVLGVLSSADRVEVEEAWARQRDELVAIRLDRWDRQDLEEPRRRALEALDEARDVLRVDRWRRLYRQGVG
jgi:hypothetical protein